MRRSATPSPPEDQVYTVGELTRRIQRLLESNWAALWVEGEISNVSRPSSGHVYFTLKDEAAQLAGVVWRSNVARLRFEPENGAKVRVFGSITVYPPHGKYQISATRIEPAGVGDLEAAYRRLYERLKKEGLFDEANKVELPEYPRTIGIVTSESGAAIHDLFSVLERRAPYARLVVRPARVQGPGSEEDVVRAIEEIDAWGEADVLIVGRGGGSIEDLWTFNTEGVARALFACRTPVISAVGHEVDHTIADWVADVRAPTPSAAAELAVPEAGDLVEEVEILGEGLVAAMSELMQRKRDRVNDLGSAAAFRGPLEYCRRRAQDVDLLAGRLSQGVRRQLESDRLRLQGVQGQLEALSPLGVLDRGYAIARRPGGEILRRAGEVAAGEVVDVLLSRGELECRVEEIREETVPVSEEKREND